MSGIRVKAVILAASVIIIIVIVSYFLLIHVPEQERKPYREAGGSEEDVNSFLAKYQWAKSANFSTVEFFKNWVKDKELAEFALSNFKDLKKTNEFLGFAHHNSSLAKVAYDQFLRDGRITLDKNSLLLEALKKYQDLNLLDKNLLLPTIQALNNITIAYKQLGLPEHDKLSLWLLTNVTQRSKDIVDFEPVIIKVDYYITNREIPIFEANYTYLERIPEGALVNPSIKKLSSSSVKSRIFQLFTLLGAIISLGMFGS